MHVEHLGEGGPRLVLVHGTLAAGWATWEAQRPLADSYRLAVVHRTGYPPNPPLSEIDFERQADEVADLIEPGTHLVGHSYGGVVSLLASARAAGRLRSLTVIEPPAFGVARGNPAVEAFITQLAPLMDDTKRSTRDFLEAFLHSVGSSMAVPDSLSPAMTASVEASRVERRPWEAEIPFEAIEAAGVPILVVSGGHAEPFEVVCEIIAERLGAARARIPGAGHSVQRTGTPFNDRLREFLGAA